MPIVRTWAARNIEHTGRCDETCRQYIDHGLNELIYRARGEAYEPKPVQCPTPARQKRELQRMLAEVHEQVAWQETELRAAAETNREYAHA